MKNGDEMEGKAMLTPLAPNLPTGVRGEHRHDVGV
jgi:hypothetical protein